MKCFVFLSSFLLVLFFNSCNQNEPTSPNGEDLKSGKLFLKIDKANAPESVVWVEAILTREGFDPVTGTMNLLSDSTADLLFENIHAGEWHLKVDAKDSAEVVLYTGETSVQIFAGFTTQVNLVLEPTGEGVGNVYIWVTWGVPTSDNWTDYSGNPILSPSGSYYETHGVAEANVLFIDGVYKMWYLGDAGGSNKFVMYAESVDGINWNRPVTDPVLSPGLPGSWDDLCVAPGAIIYEEEQYSMFYGGFSDPYGIWHTGLATSTDGINWVKYPNPILYASGGMEYQVTPSSVIKIDSIYYLYYTGRNLPYLDIRLATSIDKVNWTKYSGNPILTYNEWWEDTGVYYPCVYKTSNSFVMIFMNQAGNGFGKATSPDGINWTKDESNPFFTKEQTHNHWANYKIAYPFYLKVNNVERIYYTGFSSYESPYKIGFITK
jgi:predicted GH43/DUF377 family glycosyl hydrolase